MKKLIFAYVLMTAMVIIQAAVYYSNIAEAREEISKLQNEENSFYTGLLAISDRNVEAARALVNVYKENEKTIENELRMTRNNYASSYEVLANTIKDQSKEIEALKIKVNKREKSIKRLIALNEQTHNKLMQERGKSVVAHVNEDVSKVYWDATNKTKEAYEKAKLETKKALEEVKKLADTM